MQLSSLKDNNKLTVSVEGKIDTKTAPELEKYVLESLEGISELAIDFKKVTYISSAGLRALLQIQKQIKQQGSMKILNVSENVMDIFEMIGFSNIFTIE